MSTTGRAIRRLRDALRRRKDASYVDERTRVREGTASRVSMAVWKRTHGEVVTPEISDAEYLRKVAARDWENVQKGLSRE